MANLNPVTKKVKSYKRKPSEKYSLEVAAVMSSGESESSDDEKIDEDYCSKLRNYHK